MATIDEVYSAVRNLYFRNYFSNQCDCEEIAKAANVNVNELPEHLDALQKMGLINYSSSSKYLTFTSRGLNTKSLTGISVKKSS